MSEPQASPEFGTCLAEVRRGDRWNFRYEACGKRAKDWRKLWGSGCKRALTVPVCGVHARTRWTRYDRNAFPNA